MGITDFAMDDMDDMILAGAIVSWYVSWWWHDQLCMAGGIDEIW